jgi:hypothetical protein
VIVGDEAFPAQEHLVRPFTGKNLSLQERVFNYRLSRARRIVGGCITGKYPFNRKTWME